MEGLTIVKTFGTRIEAEIARGKLGFNKIQSIVVADDAGGQEGYLLNATGFVKLMVSKKDFEKAVKLLG